MKPKIKVGDIYEDCAYHPVFCESTDYNDVSGVSLVDGSRPRSCSLKHCGVRKLTPKEAIKLLKIWQKGGERGVMRHHGWKKAAIDKFMKEWR